jgi:hypothetical protein
MLDELSKTIQELKTTTSNNREQYELSYKEYVSQLGEEAKYLESSIRDNKDVHHDVRMLAGYMVTSKIYEQMLLFISEKRMISLI